MKGVCIVFVVITHFSWKKTERTAFLFPFWIDMAVPVFMIILGYVHSFSFEKRHLDGIKKAYSGGIWHQFIRYTLPYAAIYFLEVILLLSKQTIKGERTDFGWLIQWIKGGYGTGSYYYPVMIEFILLFPLIYFVIRRYRFGGLLICGGINGTYEVLKSVFGMSEGWYRLLVFRYILLIAFGCCTYMKKDKPVLPCHMVFNLLVAGLGICFIFQVQYLDYVPKILNFWSGTSFVASMYIMPIVGYILTSSCFKSLSCEALEQLGRASYHIFLVQMVYYEFISGFINKILRSRVVAFVVSCIGCLIGGYLFYWLENKLTGRMAEGRE